MGYWGHRELHRDNGKENGHADYEPGNPQLSFPCLSDAIALRIFQCERSVKHMEVDLVFIILLTN